MTEIARNTVTLKKIGAEAARHDPPCYQPKPGEDPLTANTGSDSRCGEVCVSIPEDARIVDVRRSADHPANLGHSWFAWDGVHTVRFTGNVQVVCQKAKNWSHAHDRPITLEVEFDR